MFSGILFNNQMDDFSIPGSPNFFGLAPSPLNYPEVRYNYSAVAIVDVVVVVVVVVMSKVRKFGEKRASFLVDLSITCHY